MTTGNSTHESTAVPRISLQGVILLLWLPLIAGSVLAAAPVTRAPAVRDHYLDVTAYPDYHRRPCPVPGWPAFGNQVQLVGDRYITVQKTVPGGSTGTVFRPNYDLIMGGNETAFSDLLERLRAAKPKLFVWNLGGYIWTDHPGGFVNYRNIEQLQSVLGEQFLGCDIGEQDGHYANGYKSITRLTNEPVEEHLKIHAIQQRVAEDHADKASLLTVMYNWHDMLRDGAVVSAAAECQNKGGVTGAQIQYAFLRGASREYGVPLAGDVSVFSSWDRTNTSLALRRRLVYSQYQWNATILSCEDAYGPAPVVADFNRWLRDFLKQYPRPGPVHCPVALLTDPFQGWMPSQTHLGQFKKHVQMPYGPGDFLTHLLLDGIYPKYYDNGIWKDESRALVATPYGDLSEVVTSDCPSPVLNGYGAVIAASDLPTGGAELRDRLNGYVESGGRLVITAANARRLWPEWKIGNAAKSFSNNSEVTCADGGATMTESLAFDVWRLDPAVIPQAEVAVTAADGTPLVVEIPRGKGGITLLASPYGLNCKPGPVVERPYPLWRQNLDSAPEQAQPYALLKHVRSVLDATLKSQQLFSIGNSQLAYIVNRLGATNYLIGIYNSQLTQQPFRLESLCGGRISCSEIPLDRLADKYPFLPAGYPGDGKPSGPAAIAAGDVRFFKVTVDSPAKPPHVVTHPVFKPEPRNRCVRMASLPGLQRQLLQWPTFFQHLGGVMLDWSELHDIDPDALRDDGSRWLNRQMLGFVIDFRSAQRDGALRLTPAAKDQDRALLKAIAAKLAILDHARDLLFSAGTAAEVDALAKIAAQPAFSNMRFHVLPLAPAARQATAARGGRLRVACTDAAPNKPQDPAAAGLMVLASNSQAVDHARTVGYPGIQVLDACYDEWDKLYADLKNVWEQPDAGLLAGRPVASRELSGTATPVRENLYLALRDPGNVQRALQNLEPVWRKVGGVKLESRLVWQMSPDACRRLGERLQQLGLKVMVDFSDHLNGWSGLTFQDLSAKMKTPDIGNHARSMRVFENVAAKLPLLGATAALAVISPVTKLTTQNAAKDPQPAANRACFDEFCRLLRERGVTVHLWFNPHRGQSRAEFRELVTATPGAMLALNLNADPDLTGGVAWAGPRLGMVVLGGGTFALKARNAVPTSSPFDGLMYGPLSLRTTSLGPLPKQTPLVLDGDYRNAEEVAADLAYLTRLLEQS